MIAVLLDPDKANRVAIQNLTEHPAFQSVDYVFVGGSLVTEGQMNQCLQDLKRCTNKPAIIFPGNPNQIDSQADSILLLSLISGRNPDLLIGKHVESAQQLKKSGLEVIPTSYILIDGGKTTTVSYISNTIPIPQDKPDIASSTALAGELLGYKLCYMDCGSGAKWPVHPELIKKVKQEISVPLIIGGGIRTKNQAEAIFKAGADIVVVGNKLEEDPQFLEDLVLTKHQLNSASIQTP